MPADNQKQNASIQLKADFPSLPCDVIDIDSRKAISSIVCEQPCGDQDLFDVIANQWLDPLSKNPKQRIALVGQTQIGKTQVLKNLIKHFLSFEKPQYDYVFYVPLEFVNCSDKMNLLQFLTNQCSLRWIDCQSNRDHELFKRVVERISGSKQEKICIILDDVEKSNFSYNQYFYDKSYFEKVEAGYFVSNILRKWFRNGQKILILNPWEFSQLSQENALKPMEVVYVLGIDHDGQRQIVNNNDLHCNRIDCELGNACLGFTIKNHEAVECAVCRCCHHENCHHEIQALCYVPCNCQLLLRQRNTVRPSSPVTVASSVLVHKLSKAFHHRAEQLERCRFFEISRFAWMQYADNVFLFDESELVNSGLTRKEINLFFSSRTENPSFEAGIVEDLVFFFSHVFLQELLAALWLLSRPSEDFKSELKTYKESFVNGKFVVLRDCMLEICSLKKYQNSRFWNIQQNNVAALREVLN